MRPLSSLWNYITSALALTFSPNSSTIGECLGEQMNFGRWGFRCSKRDTGVRETQKTVIPKRFAKYPYNSPENIREQFGREMRFSLHILIRFFWENSPSYRKTVTDMIQIFFASRRHTFPLPREDFWSRDYFPLFQTFAYKLAIWIKKYIFGKLQNFHISRYCSEKWKTWKDTSEYP